MGEEAGLSSPGELHSHRQAVHTCSPISMLAIPLWGIEQPHQKSKQAVLGVSAAVGEPGLILKMLFPHLFPHPLLHHPAAQTSASPRRCHHLYAKTNSHPPVLPGLLTSTGHEEEGEDAKHVGKRTGESREQQAEDSGQGLRPIPESALALLTMPGYFPSWLHHLPADYRNKPSP